MAFYFNRHFQTQPLPCMISFIMQVYLRLIRLPLLPSTLGNICLGALSAGISQAGISQADFISFILLLLSSAFLYSSGMAWNDYFDAKIDAVERPERPLPSGSISPKNASTFAFMLMVTGIAIAFVAEFLRDFSGWSIPITLLISFFVLAYDAGGKNFFFGPVLMGACRFFNVLLGWSVVTQPSIGFFDLFDGWSLLMYPFPAIAFLQAGIVGVYIAGVTWFAKNEANQSNRTSLVLASCIIIVALLTSLSTPGINQSGTPPPLMFPYLFFLLIVRIGKRLFNAIKDPSPKNVQGTVVTCLKSLVLLDCILTIGVAGWVGLWILILLVPNFIINRFKNFYTT